MDVPSKCIAALIVALTVFVVGCGREEEVTMDPPAVTIYTANAAEVPIYREWVGQTKGSFNVDIRARVEGFVQAITYKEGSEVVAGQTLFKIDPSAYVAYVNQARARLAEAQAAQARSLKDVVRYQALVQENAISAQEYEAAVALNNATTASVAAANAALQRTQLDLSYCNVTSPISGLASIAKFGAGSLVGRGDATLLATVSKLDPIRVTFNLSEKEFLDYLRSAANGSASSMPVELRLADGSTWPHIGKLVVADNAIDPLTGTLRVEAEFSNPGGFLRPGLFGRVLVMIEKRPNAIVIPARAISELQGQTRVAVVKNNIVGYRNIETGDRIGGAIVVNAGLVAGEQIIVDGLQKIQEGLPVRATPSKVTLDSLLKTN